MVMNFRGLCPLSAHAIVVAVLSSRCMQQARSVLRSALRGADAAPWFGTWQLEPPKTAPRWFETPPYKKVTITIEPSGEASGEARDKRRERHCVRGCA